MTRLTLGLLVRRNPPPEAVGRPRSRVCLPGGKVVRVGTLGPYVSDRTLLRAGSGEACSPSERGFRRLVCPVDGTKVDVYVPCKAARLCPTCVEAWSWSEGRKAAWRLAHVQKKRRYRYPARHVVISLGWQPETVDEADAYLRACWRVLKGMGVSGGALIAHPERHATEVGEVTWREGWHVHAVVFGHVDNERRPMGAFVRTLDERITVAGTFAYLLNHSWVQPGKHSVRWFGTLSYNTAGRIPRAPRAERACPLCGGPLEPIDTERSFVPAERDRTYYPRSYGNWH